MDSIILENEDVNTDFVRKSKIFIDYLKEAGITETGEAYGFSNYRVASGLNGKEATDRLCTIAGDMLVVFDVDPTSVRQRGDSRLEFANQFGIFYVDKTSLKKK